MSNRVKTRNYQMQKSINKAVIELATNALVMNTHLTKDELFEFGSREATPYKRYIADLLYDYGLPVELIRCKVYSRLRTGYQSKNALVPIEEGIRANIEQSFDDGVGFLERRINKIVEL